MQNSLIEQAAAIDALHTQRDVYAPGLSWGAVLAGAAAAAALSVILLMLGFGLGLSSVSPYSYHAAPLGMATVAWLAFTQLAASGIGGYLAGRLRVKWVSVHRDEVHFRDTAHGLLAWAVATLVVVGLLAGSVNTVLGNAGAAASAVKAEQPQRYYSDLVLRGSDAASDAQRAEVERIFGADIAAGKLSDGDRNYLAELLAKRTGTAQVDAVQRVDDIFARAVKAIDDARKLAAHAALWMFVALLFGAFFASLMATFGGRARDHERVIVRSSL